MSAGTTYEFKIVARNEVGPSTQSGSIAIKAAQAPTAPDAPTKASADKSSIQITWAAPADDGSSEITGYEIYWDNNSGVIDTSVPLTTTNAQT